VNLSRTRLATRSTYGDTLGMKTAVSIPNDLFEGAERLARRTRRSRSRLFSDALREYLAHHAPDNVTELMDKALGQIGAGKDTLVSSAGKRTLYEIAWRSSTGQIFEFHRRRLLPCRTIVSNQSGDEIISLRSA
jgi:predicted transcriptional regulator